jgi:hypothetical protein
MKKYVLIPMILFNFLLTGNSQDKIITRKNDTIKCKITKVSHSAVYFDIIINDVRSSGKLPRKNVSDYTVSDMTVSGRRKAPGTDSFKQLHLSIMGGTGYLTGSTEQAEEDLESLGFKTDEIKSYYRDLKSGLIADADIAFMISQKFGVGLKYIFFESSCSMEGFYDPQDGVNLFYSTFKEQIYVNYAGPFFIFHQSLRRDKSLMLNCTCATGLALYRNEAEFLKEFLLMKGKNLGVDASAGLEYFITPYFSLGAGFSAFSSTIKKMNVSNGIGTSVTELEKGEYENLSRLDLSLAIRFYIWNK